MVLQVMKRIIIEIEDDEDLRITKDEVKIVPKKKKITPEIDWSAYENWKPGEVLLPTKPVFSDPLPWEIPMPRSPKIKPWGHNEPCRECSGPLWIAGPWTCPSCGRHYSSGTLSR